MEVDVPHRHDLDIPAAGRATLHAERGAERRLADAQHRLLADVVEGVGQSDRRRGLAFAPRGRRDRAPQDQLPVRPAPDRFNQVHRHLGLVVAVGLEVFRGDAEPLARDVEDRPLLGGLRDFDVGFGLLVLPGKRRSLRGGSGTRIHENLIPVVRLAFVANSFAATFGPSAWTRVTLKRPSAHTTVKPSPSTATISPILPAMPLGSLAGSGLASKILTVLPSS